VAVPAAPTARAAHPTAASVFAVGDRVVATWAIAGSGGLADYGLVDARLTAACPPSVSAVDGAALANSAGHALLAVRAATVAPGERVLVLGGGGGVGTALVQWARAAGAGFIAATGADAGRLAATGVDEAIPYGEREWSTLPPGTPPYDVVFDCAVGDAAWAAVTAAPLGAVLKGAHDGGRCLAIHHAARIVMHGWVDLVRWSVRAAARVAVNRCRRAEPRYIDFIGRVDGGVLREVLAAAADGTLRAVIEPAGPFPQTTEGVRAAFNLHASRHARGKVVIRVAPETGGGWQGGATTQPSGPERGG